MSHLAPAGRYSMATRIGDRIVTAGITPRRDGTMMRTGRLGAEITPEQGRELTEAAVSRAIDAAASIADSPLSRVAVMTVYLSVAPGFTALSPVADGAANLLLERFPGAPLPVRTAVGVQSLPDGAPVEVQLVCTVDAE